MLELVIRASEILRFVACSKMTSGSLRFFLLKYMHCTLSYTQFSYMQRHPLDSLAEFEEFEAIMKRDHQLLLDTVSVQLRQFSLLSHAIILIV